MVRWSWFLFSLIPLVANAKELSVEEVWRGISDQSVLQRASHLKQQAAAEGESKARRHWLPHVYLDGRAYQTNDPGQSFFSLLSQRSLTNADFDPDKINHPKERLYSRGALGIDLPLYEGGAGVNAAELQTHLASLSRFESVESRVKEYSEVVRAYGSLSAIEKQEDQLSTAQSVLKRLIGKYQLGSKGNPVGYSGLLGFKSLLNRIDGLILENKSKSEALYAQLRQMGLSVSDWRPGSVELGDFADKYLPSNSGSTSVGQKARTEGAKALESKAQMERARFHPRIGAFAEKYLFNGDRETADGYSAGIYLRWNLFNPNDYGSGKQSTLEARAVAAQVEYAGRMERAESEALQKAEQALKENLKLLQNSAALMEEQVRTAEVLFRNGSINALQLGEVLARRVDLISSHLEAQLNLLKVKADLANKHEFHLPNSMENI